MCQITSCPLPPQPNKDKINSDNKLEVWTPSLLSEKVKTEHQKSCQFRLYFTNIS